MSTLLPHTGLVVPDNAPRVADMNVTHGQVEATVVDDHGILGHILGNTTDGLSFTPSHPTAVQTMGQFVYETAHFNAGPFVFGDAGLALMLDEYVWQCHVDWAHQAQEYLVRYVATDFTRHTWRLSPETPYPDYAACVRLLLQNPRGWAYDVLEADVWAGPEDGWVVVYPPPQPPKE